MRLGAWRWAGAVMLATAGALQGQDPSQGVALAAAGPRFLAPAEPGSSEVGSRWSDASNAAVLRQQISVDLKEVRLRDALAEIARKAGLRLTYSAAVVPLDVPVTLSAANLTVGAVLSAVLYDAGVDVLLTSRGRAAIVKRGSLGELQVGAIVGHVSDSLSGQGIGLTTVTVVGTGLAARTGDDGAYRIANVPPGVHTVRAARIGYASASQSVTVVADQDSTVDFILTPQATQLEEVVAIGYGTTERRDLTGAVSSVSADQIRSAPVPSLDQALLGKAAGVQVVTASGQPGAVAMVRIRGGNSIYARNDPLYVIDGVPVTTNLDEATTGTLLSQSVRGINPVAAVNPEDIESIDVLKDASASAIYGARGGNGVVLITTKRGRAGHNAVSFGSYYGVQEVRRRLPVLDATQFAQMVNTAYTNVGQPPPYSAADIAGFGAGTDWQDVIFRTAAMRNYDMSISGGDDRTSYYVSGSLLQDDGVVIGTGMNRGSFRLNFDRTVSHRFRFGNRLAVSRSKGQVLPNAGLGQEVPSVILNAVMAPPTLPVRTAGGEYFSGDDILTGRPFPNPVASALEITNEERQYRTIGNVFAEYDVRDGLTLRSSFGLDYLTSLQDFYSPSTTLPGRNFNGQGSRGEAQTTSWVNENTLHFNRRFGDRYSVDLVGGLTFQRTNSTPLSGTANDFLTDRLRQNGLSTGKVFQSIYTGEPHSSLLSYFARANWGVSDKYLFTLTGRIDGSSKFGAGHRYGFFPSGAVAWRASEEGFVKRLGMFDDLKLRVSYGRTGNQDIGNNNALATLYSTVYVFGGARAIGFAPGNPANPDLKWETTDQLDIGADATFLKNRVTIITDYYHKKTHDLLYYTPLPGTTGFFSSLRNIGSVRNRGFELSISTVNLTGPLGWESSLNVGWNRNKVLNLGPDSLIIGLGGVGAGAVQDPTVLKVGEPINSFYGWVYAGMQSGEPVYRDLDGDGAFSPGDRTIIGNAQPDYTGGLTNRLTYRNFELYVFLQWSVGNKIYNINRSRLTTAAGNANQLRDVVSGGRGIRAPKVGNSFDGFESDLFVEDGTYLRGKNLRLSYTLPATWLRAVHFQKLSTLQLYVSAQNFFTRTDYSGFDPEISEYAGSNLAQGFDFGTYPQPRQITFGFTAGF